MIREAQTSSGPQYGVVMRLQMHACRALHACNAAAADNNDNLGRVRRARTVTRHAHFTSSSCVSKLSPLRYISDTMRSSVGDWHVLEYDLQLSSRALMGSM
jgi:hypothetical protein